MKRIALVILCFTLLLGAVACGQDKPAVTESGTEGATEGATEIVTDTESQTETMTDTESRDEAAETETQALDYSFDQMKIYSFGTSLKKNKKQSGKDAISAIVLNDRCIYYIEDWGKGFEVPMKDRYDFSLCGCVGTDTAWIIKRQSPRTADGSARCYDYWMWKFDRETSTQVKSAFSLPIQNPPTFESSEEEYEEVYFDMVDENTGYIFIFRWHWYDGYDLSFLAKTTDGGSNWTMIDPDPSWPGTNRKDYIVECCFFDEIRGMFISSNNGLTTTPVVAFTFDGGKTWSYIHLPWEDYNPNDDYCLEFDSYWYYAPTTNHEEELFLVLKLPKNGEHVIFVSNDLKTWRLTDCIL